MHLTIYETRKVMPNLIFGFIETKFSIETEAHNRFLKTSFILLCLWMIMMTERSQTFGTPVRRFWNSISTHLKDIPLGVGTQKCDSLINPPGTSQKICIETILHIYVFRRWNVSFLILWAKFSSPLLRKNCNWNQWEFCLIEYYRIRPLSIRGIFMETYTSSESYFLFQSSRDNLLFCLWHLDLLYSSMWQVL